MNDTLDYSRQLRNTEYRHLPGAYLDHAGSTCRPRQLIDLYTSYLSSDFYGNTYTTSPQSDVLRRKVDKIRHRALKFANADPKEWDLVFVANTAAAVELVVESFRSFVDSKGTHLRYAYHCDSDTSLDTPKKRAHSSRCFADDEEVAQWIEGKTTSKDNLQFVELFAYSGQSDITGRRLPLDWCNRIADFSSDKATFALFDATALACTTPINLSNVFASPHIVSLDYGKMFGFDPLGALLIQKRESLYQIFSCRRYSGKGTTRLANDDGGKWSVKKSGSLHESLEHGTIPLDAIVQIDFALDVNKNLFDLTDDIDRHLSDQRAMKVISASAASIAKTAYIELCGLKHKSGKRLIKMDNERLEDYDNNTIQGPVIAFNVVRSNGTNVPCIEVERRAAEQNITLRTITRRPAERLEPIFSDQQMVLLNGRRRNTPVRRIEGNPTELLRISFGAPSVKKDVRDLILFLSKFYVE